MLKQSLHNAHNTAGYNKFIARGFRASGQGLPGRWMIKVLARRATVKSHTACPGSSGFLTLADTRIDFPNNPAPTLTPRYTTRIHNKAAQHQDKSTLGPAGHILQSVS